MLRSESTGIHKSKARIWIGIVPFLTHDAAVSLIAVIFCSHYRTSAFELSARQDVEYMAPSL